MHRLRWIMGLGLLLACQMAPARADLIISVGNGFVDPGKTTTVDVYVRSTTGTDTLDNFSLQYLLQLVTPLGSATASFTNPQSDSQLTNPGYVLAGDSLAALIAPVSLTSISTTTNTNDTYFGGDGTVSMLGVPVPTTNQLLTRLNITAGAGSAGNVYQLSLQGGPFTMFNDPNFASIPFTTTAGSVTITPEPATLLLFAAAVGGGLVTLRRRRGQPA